MWYSFTLVCVLCLAVTNIFHLNNKELLDFKLIVCFLSSPCSTCTAGWSCTLVADRVTVCTTGQQSQSGGVFPTCCRWEHAAKRFVPFSWHCRTVVFSLLSKVKRFVISSKSKASPTATMLQHWGWRVQASWCWQVTRVESDRWQELMK